MEEDKQIKDFMRSVRRDFSKGKLLENQVAGDPLTQFSNWFAEAAETGNELANAMVLSTVDADGMPSSRVMLLRDISFGGFTFFTNYFSRKGRELESNPKAALLFFWPQQERQVRVQGVIERLPAAESDAYFSSRPHESQVGAWASQQSAVIKNRQVLDENYTKALSAYGSEKVPRPSHWGGYVLAPTCIEFWQGRPSRLHDRLQFRLVNGQWMMERLMP